MTDSPLAPHPPVPQSGKVPPLITAPTSAAALQPRKRRRWVWPVAAAVCFLVGVGAGGSGGGETVAAQTHDRVVEERDEFRDRLEDAEAAARGAASQLAEQRSALDARAAELDTRQSALEAREVAVTATEQVVAASQVGIGTWTVGIDIEPGVYRAADVVTSTCYWGIYRSGSNGDDIVQNDIVQGGFPSVTLREGQDFENGCGVFVKQ